jgi:GLPGLI family protein
MTDTLRRTHLHTTLSILVLVTCLFSGTCNSQDINASAISYTATVDLSQFDPVYYDLTDADTTDVYFEVDLYYSNGNVRSIIRINSRPADYEPHFNEVLYNPGGQVETLVDHTRKKIFRVVDVQSPIIKLKATKKILGYQCRGYITLDYKGEKVIAFVTKKLPTNISPLGNMNLPGTALEVITANGFHYVATDFSQGKLPSTFFSLPTDYQIETISAAAGD